MEHFSGTSTAIAAHIRSVYSANADARTVVTESIRCAKLAADAQYDPGLLSKISSGIGGSQTYYPITRIKAKSAAAWISKILTTAEKPWSITPTPDPDLDEAMVQEISNAAYAESQRIQRMGLFMTPEDHYDFAQDMRTLIMQQRNSRASDAAAKAETLIADKLAESGFDDALAEFLIDFALYPAAFMRAKVTMDKKSKVTSPSDGVYIRQQEVEEARHFERISPVRVFPSPGQVYVDDDDLVIVSLYSVAEIAEMANIPGFNAQEISCLVAEHRDLGSDYNRDPLDSFPEAKLYSSDTNRYRRATRLAALEYYGKVSGAMLKQWSLSPVSAVLTEKEDAEDDFYGNEDTETVETSLPDYADTGIAPDEIDENRFYNIFAISIHDRCVYCRITDDEPRWLYSASFERNPDSIWGIGIADMLKHVQSDINAIRRATMNNLNLTAYPQVVINDDVLAQFAPGSRAALVPGKVWHVRNSFQGTVKPVDFFNIPSVYPQLSTEFEKALIMADRVSGIPEYSQGLASGAKNGAAGTASGLSMLLEAAGNQIKDPINNIDNGVIEPLIRELYYELLDDPEVPDEAKGDFKIVALGANGLMFKEQVTQRRREFLQLVMASPLLQQIIKPEGVTALVREVADGLNMETDDLVPTKTEQAEQKAAAEQQAQQQLDAMLAQQVSGGNPGQVQPPPESSGNPALPVQVPQGV